MDSPLNKMLPMYMFTLVRHIYNCNYFCTIFISTQIKAAWPYVLVCHHTNFVWFSV